MLLLPRDGWEAISLQFYTLARLPGGLFCRENATRTFLKAKWCWAAPLLRTPPKDFVKKLFQALLNYTGCKWWCHSRFWIDRINLHPIFGTSIDSVIATSRLKPNSPLQSCVEHHLSVLGLDLIEWNDDGAFVAPKPRQPGLMRVLGPYLKKPQRWGSSLFN